MRKRATRARESVKHREVSGVGDGVNTGGTETDCLVISPQYRSRRQRLRHARGHPFSRPIWSCPWSTHIPRPSCVHDE